MLFGIVSTISGYHHSIRRLFSAKTYCSIFINIDIPIELTQTLDKVYLLCSFGNVKL